MFSNHTACLLLLLITLLVCRNNFRASACSFNEFSFSRNGDNVTLQCKVFNLNGELHFCRNTTTFETVTDQTNDQQTLYFKFIIDKQTEGVYKCCCGGCQNSCPEGSTILASLVRNNNVPPQHQVSWGQPINIQCPYSPGVFISKYTFNWDLNSNRPVPNIDTTAGSVQLDKANNSLTILKFNPLFEGRYECTLETNEDNKKMSNITVSLEASNLSAAIVKSPSDVSLRNEESKEATFSCQASIKQKEVLGFRTHVNGASLDRLAKDRTNCTVNRNIGTLTCNETVENSIQRHVLSCDFNEPYLVSCNFTITGLAEADSNVVECFLTNGTSDVDNKFAGLFIIPDTLPDPKLTISDDNKLLTLNITFDYPVTVSNISLNVTIGSINIVTSNVSIDKATVVAMVDIPEGVSNNSSVSYSISFGKGEPIKYNGMNKPSLILNPTPSTIPTVVPTTSGTVSSTLSVESTPISTSNSIPSSSVITPTVDPVTSYNVIAVASGVSVGTVVLVLLILCAIISMIVVLKKGRASNKKEYLPPISSSIAENGGSPQQNVHCFYLSPRHSNNIDGSQVSTIDTYIGDQSPNHASSMHSSRSSHSHSSNSCPSTQHLRLSKPLPRYGIPDHQYQSQPQPNPAFSLPVSLPGINVITPTPTMENQPSLGEYTDDFSPTETEPFESLPHTPSTDVTASLPNRPRDLHIPANSVESPGTTPLSDQTMIGVLLYLQHTNCDKKDTCQTCKLIERHFTRIAKKYGDGALTGMVKNLNTPGAENTLKYLRKREKKAKNVRSPHRPQQPPLPHPFKRQRSMSASHLDDEELTFSSTETEDDSSLSTRRFKGKHRMAVTDDEREIVEYPPRLHLRQIKEEVSLSQNDLPRTPIDIGGLPNIGYSTEHQKKTSSVSVESGSTDSSTTSRPDSGSNFTGGMSASCMRAQSSTDVEDGLSAELMQPKNSHSLKYEKMKSNTSTSTSSGYDTDSGLFRPALQTHRYMSSGSSEQESIQESTPLNSKHGSNHHHGHHHGHNSHHDKHRHHDNNGHHHSHHRNGKYQPQSNYQTNSDYSLDASYALGRSITSSHGNHRKTSVPNQSLSPSTSGVISTHSSPDRYGYGSGYGSQPSIGSNHSNHSIRSESALPYTMNTQSYHHYSPPNSWQKKSRTPSPIKLSLPSDDSSATPL